MASSMGGAVAGSVIGHGISNMLFGGSGAQQVQQPLQEGQPMQPMQETTFSQCEPDQKALMRCLETSGDASKCQMYLEMLSQCKQSAQENSKWA